MTRLWLESATTMGVPDMPGRAQGPLVGRADELAWLHGCLREAAQGLGGPVLLAGEAGVGKTRLLHEFLASVDPGVLVLTGNCLDLRSDDIPLLPVMGWLHDAVSALGAETVARAAGPFRGELSRLDPALGEPDQRSQDPYRLLVGTRYLLRALADDRVLVVVIEDVHWADPATLELLQFLATEMRHATSLGVATIRTDEPGDTLAGAQQAQQIPEVSRLDLHRLPLADAELLASALLGARDVSTERAASLADRSGGNPFYLEELATIDSEDLPDTLRGLLLSRVRALPADTAELVELLAVGDPPVAYDQWRAAAALPAEAVDKALAQATTGGVLASGRGDHRVAFRHSLVRDAVLETLLPGNAARLHRQWALALDPLTHDSAQAAFAAARHWHAAGDPGPALRSALAAAAAAAALHAHQLRAALLDRVVDLWPRASADEVASQDLVQVLRDAAHAHMSNGQPGLASARLETALGLVDPDTDPATVSAILSDRGEVEMYGSQIDPRPSYRAALAVLPESGYPGPRARALAAMADYATLTSVPHQALAQADEAVTLARQAGDGATEALALRGRGMAEAFTDPQRSIEDHRAAIGAAMQSGADNVLISAMSSLLVVLGACQGRDQQAHDEGIHFIATAEQLGLRGHPVSAFIHEGVGEALVNLGQLDEALTHFDVVLSQRTMYGLGLRAQSFRVQIAFIRGDLDGAMARYAELTSTSHDAPQSASPMWQIPVARQTASVADATDGPAAAWEVLEPWISGGVGRGGGLSLFQDVDLVFSAATYAAEAGLLASPTSPEVALLSKVQQLAEEQLAKMPHPRMLDAVLAPARGHDPAELWRCAADAFDQVDGPTFWRAHTRIQLAEATDSRAEALDSLDRAQADASRLRALSQLEAIRALRHRIESGPNPAGLTPREIEILQLVDQGLSNRQIGERLFISRSTAGVHLSHILTKLDVPDRVAAAAWARERRLIARAGRDPRPISEA